MSRAGRAAPLRGRGGAPVRTGGERPGVDRPGRRDHPPGAGGAQRARADPLLRRRDRRAARTVSRGDGPAAARRRGRADRHRRRPVRRRAVRPARGDRRPGRLAGVPRRPADRDPRPVRLLPAGRPAAPARAAHPRRVRGAAGPRRAGPLRPGRCLGAPAGARAATTVRWPPGAPRSSSPSPSIWSRRSTASTPSRSAHAGRPSSSSPTWARTGWPAPAWSCRRSARTASRRCAGGGTPGCSARRTSWTGCAGSWRGGCRGPRPARRRASAGCGWSRSRRCRPVRTSSRCGAAPARRTSGRTAPLARVQTLLGHGSVLAPVLDGGRDPAQRTRLVPWGDEPVAVRSPQQPWPGRLPAPAPSVLLDPPRPARLLDAAGRPVLVTERGADARPAGVCSRSARSGRWRSPPGPGRGRSTSAGGVRTTARQVVRCQVVDVPRPGLPGQRHHARRAWEVDAIYD